MTRTEARSTLRFDRWKYSIQTATDIDDLMLVLQGYLSGWTADDRRMLPDALAGRIRSTTDLMERAVDASRAEVEFEGAPDQYVYVRELALTLCFAASRLRYLQAVRSSGRV